MSLDYMAESESLMGNAEVQDLINMVDQQIKNPFETSTNYYKELIKLLDEDDAFMEEICRDVIKKICETYDMEIDPVEIEDFEKALEVSKSLYKFFIKNANSLTYIFLRNYINNNKARKNLISAYDIKSAFPKDKYGKKENYILILRLKDIIKDIQDLDITLDRFLSTIEEADEDKAYMDFIRDADDNNIIKSKNAVKKLIKGFRKSESYGKMVNKLTIDIFKDIINPSLKQIGIDPKETLIFNYDSAVEVSEDNDTIDNE